MNFKDADEIKTTTILIDGWRPLSIKYGLVKVSRAVFLIWQVVGTSHIFKVDLKMVTLNHKGLYDKHFCVTLDKFRTDLIDWYYERNQDIDMSAYIHEFAPLIIEKKAT